MQLNYENFFRWHTGEAIDDTVNIPRIGVVDPGRCYRPVIKPGEVTGLFINLRLPFLDNDDISNLHLRLVGGADIGAVLNKVTAGTGYRLYTTFSLPATVDGAYQFEIYNTSTSSQKCVSNWFRVMNDAGPTSFVKFKNSRNIYDYQYELIPDFYNQFRLHLSVNSVSAEGGASQVQNVATGRRRNANGISDKSFQLSTYYFDDGAHDAAIALIEHDSIEINGRSYIKKGAYTPNIRVNSKLSVGQADLYEQAFSSVNKYGQLPIPRVAAKLVTIPGLTITSYSVNDLAMDVYNGVIYDSDVPKSGYIVINGSGNVQIAKIDQNGGVIRQGASLPVTIQQSEFYGIDHAVAFLP